MVQYEEWLKDKATIEFCERVKAIVDNRDVSADEYVVDYHFSTPYRYELIEKFGNRLTLSSNNIPENSIASYFLKKYKALNLDSYYEERIVCIPHDLVAKLNGELFTYSKLGFNFLFENEEDAKQIERVYVFGNHYYGYLPTLVYYDEASGTLISCRDADVYFITSKAGDTIYAASYIGIDVINPANTPYKLHVLTEEQSLTFSSDIEDFDIEVYLYNKNIKELIFSKSNFTGKIYNKSISPVCISADRRVKDLDVTIYGAFTLRAANKDKYSKLKYKDDDMLGISYTFGTELLAYSPLDVPINKNIYFGNNVVYRGIAELTTLSIHKLGLISGTKGDGNIDDYPEALNVINENFNTCVCNDKEIQFLQIREKLKDCKLYLQKIDSTLNVTSDNTDEKINSPMCTAVTDKGDKLCLTVSQALLLWLSGINLINIIRLGTSQLLFAAEDIDEKNFGYFQFKIAPNLTKEDTFETYIPDGHSELAYFKCLNRYAMFPSFREEGSNGIKVSYNNYRDKITLRDIISYRTAYRERVKDFQVAISLSKYVMSSRQAGFLDGVIIEIQDTCRYTSSQLKKKNVVMDNPYYAEDYLIFMVNKAGDDKTYAIDNETFYALLKSEAVICEATDIEILPGTVIWLPHETDKSVVEGIKEYNRNRILLGIDEKDSRTQSISFQAEKTANQFKMFVDNVQGTDLLIPSFVTDLDFVSDNQTLCNFGIEVSASSPVDVGNNFNNIVNGIVKRTIIPIENIITSENAYIGEDKDNQITINSSYAIRNIILPKGAKIYLSAYGNLNDEEAFHKVLVRSGSKVDSISYFDQVEVEKNVIIGSIRRGLKTLILHGGILPENSCLDNLIEKVIIDGGLEYIDPLAFDSHIKVEIECINGGAYKLINIAGENIRRTYEAYEEDMKEGTLSSIPSGPPKKKVSYEFIDVNPHYYSNLIVEAYEKFKEADRIEGVIHGIPVKINIDGTIVILTEDNKTFNMSVGQILDYIASDKLKFEHTLPSGETINFIDTLKYSGYKTLVFYPGINNCYCDSIFRVLLQDYKDMHRFLRHCNIIIAYQEDEWMHGIKDMPYKLLGIHENYIGGIYFDSSTYACDREASIAIVCSAIQNFNYYQRKSVLNDITLSTNKEDLDKYYLKYDMYRWGGIEHAYFPASMEFDFEFNRIKSPRGVGGVTIGGKSLYGRYNYKTTLPSLNAKEITLIPGFGENKVIHYYPDTLTGSGISYASSIISNLQVLNIETPTIIEPYCFALAFDNKKEIVLKKFFIEENSLRELNVRSNTRMHITSLLFDKVIVENGAVLHVDAKDIGNVLSDKYYNYYHATQTISVAANSYLIVTDFDALQFAKLVKSGAINLATILLMHAINYEELLKDSQVQEVIALNGIVVGEHPNSYISEAPMIAVMDYDNCIGDALTVPISQEDEIQDADVQDDESDSLPENDIDVEPVSAEELETKELRDNLEDKEYTLLEKPEIYQQKKAKTLDDILGYMRSQIDTLDKFFTDLEEADRLAKESLEKEIPDIIDFNSQSEEVIFEDDTGRKLRESMLRDISDADRITLEVVPYDETRYKVTNLETGVTKILLLGTVEKLSKNIKYVLLYNE